MQSVPGSKDALVKFRDAKFLYLPGLTQNRPSKARRRSQYELYGKEAQRRWGGFASVLLCKPSGSLLMTNLKSSAEAHWQHAKDTSKTLTTAARIVRDRIAVIDVMRGLVMLFMLVDHVRETFYLHMQVSDPMNLETTAPSLFFTRLSAHFCAPIFVFLAGLSAWLYAHPASGPRSATGFLVKRGLLLVALELTLVNLAWTGTVPPTILYLQVIWVIGLSMIVLGLLLRLPYGLLALLGLVIVFGHNLLTPITFEPGSAGYGLWTVLHDRGYLVADGPLKIKVSYPLLPWIGVILLGYVTGPLYARTFAAEKRRRLLVILGGGSLALLALLRGLNLYGETLPWVHGDSFLQTAMSWLNFTKYPPSLGFLLLSIGAGLLLFAWFETFENRFTRLCATFGGAPMFFYLLHLYALLLLQKTLVALFGPTHGIRFGVDHVWMVWLCAALLIPLLYYPCRAFARFKRTTSRQWPRYL